MGFLIGNEANVQNGNGYNSGFWSAMNQIASAVKNKAPNKLVSIAITDALDQVNLFDSILPDVDFWSLQVYRGHSFGSLFSEYATRSSKPLIITEFGYDSFDGRKNSEYSRQAALPADAMENLWLEIKRTLRLHLADVSLNMQTNGGKQAPPIHTILHLNGRVRLLTEKQTKSGGACSKLPTMEVSPTSSHLAPCTIVLLPCGIRQQHPTLSTVKRTISNPTFSLADPITCVTNTLKLASQPTSSIGVRYLHKIHQIN